MDDRYLGFDQLPGGRFRMNYEYYGDQIYELFDAGREGETYLKARRSLPDQKGEFAAVRVPRSWCQEK